MKAATIKLMAIGCDDLVLALERAGTVKTKRPQAIREAQRRHNVLGLREIRPGQAWNVDQINRWLNRNPIQGEANIDFVRRQLESANFGPVLPVPDQPPNNPGGRNRNDPNIVAARFHQQPGSDGDEEIPRSLIASNCSQI